jgi:hypothetical protein
MGRVAIEGEHIMKSLACPICAKQSISFLKKMFMNYDRFITCPYCQSQLRHHAAIRPLLGIINYLIVISIFVLILLWGIAALHKPQFSLSLVPFRLLLSLVAIYLTLRGLAAVIPLTPFERNPNQPQSGPGRVK